jgi:glycerophosphoryl diester phosphodiesterase
VGNRARIVQDERKAGNGFPSVACRWTIPRSWVFDGDGMIRTRPIVIAHRGASGYLPEHTLAGKAMAHALGADYLEQDIVLSRDGVPLVLHDIVLDETTDVASRFPDRARPDGRWYAIDFDLSELRCLSVRERLDPASGCALYPDRFPLQTAPSERLFGIATLDEELRLIRGLNRSTGRVAGIYPELKAPAWHFGQGQDILANVLPVLERYGYLSPGERIFLQCFEPDALMRLHRELAGMLPLIQLIGEPDWWPEPPADFARMRSCEGLAEIARYAIGIGPWIGHLSRGLDAAGRLCTTSLAADARAAGLLVHPYTFRRDRLPAGFASFEDLLRVFADDLGIDGLFTDFPDLALRFFAASRNSARTEAPDAASS